MIQLRTMLTVADNSGAVIIQCIGIPGFSKKRYAEIGQIITCAVKKASPRKEIKQGQVIKALIVRQRKALRRKNGSYVRFFDNAAVILGEKNVLKATRIFGPIPREIKALGYNEIASLAPVLV